MGKVHNKAIFEQRGFINIANTFPEFAEGRGWLQLGLERSLDNFLAQTTEDGVQREWSGGYHTAVLRDVSEIAQRMRANGIAVPAAYQQRYRAMVDYLFGITTPYLEIPMFGDSRRYELVQPADSQVVSASLEPGWYAWEYGKRVPRAAVAYRHTSAVPAAFLTLVLPYRGSSVPEARAHLAPDFVPGAGRVELAVELSGASWHIGRDLATGQGWATR